uniref:Amino acid transporter transmembrane domain-containing protein n=1 Tax=Bicosoecida sp. CB-2014 TaxID=1486930 RepID=A0A7S1G4C1_9STRA
MAVPLLGVCTNYPLIAIVLRENLIITYQLAADALLRRDAAIERERRGDGFSKTNLRTPLVQVTDVSYGESGQSSAGFGDLSFARGESESNVFAQKMMSGDVESSQVTKVVVGLIAAVPSLLVAATRANVATIISLAGSYGGCMIMFVFPALFVHAARGILNRRADLPEVSSNPFKSPFQHVAWVGATLLFAATALIIVTNHFVTEGFGGDDHVPCVPTPAP